jgi:hypothetical protein
MSRYRRAKFEGGVFFFTVTLAQFFTRVPRQRQPAREQDIQAREGIWQCRY